MRAWAPTAVVVALLAATAVAFATTERQKLEKTPFGVARVSHYVSDHGAAVIALRLHRPHLLTVAILDDTGRAVATIAREQRFERGNVRLVWHPAVSDGTYEPRVTLDDGREFQLQNQIKVDSTPPVARLVSYRPHVLRRRAKPEVKIVYRVSESAHILLYVNGRRALKGGAKSLQFAVNWATKIGGRRLRPGRYRLQLAAVDLAGNVGRRTSPFVVRIR